MKTYQKRQFSIADKRRERAEKRIHFDRFRRSPRRTTRPLWWLFMLLIVVLGIMIYLNNIR
jgi:hypothetical protein